MDPVLLSLYHSIIVLYFFQWHTWDQIQLKCNDKIISGILVSLFNGLSIFMGYLMQETPLKKYSRDRI